MRAANFGLSIRGSIRRRKITGVVSSAEFQPAKRLRQSFATGTHQNNGFGGWKLLGKQGSQRRRSAGEEARQSDSASITPTSHGPHYCHGRLALTRRFRWIALVQNTLGQEPATNFLFSLQGTVDNRATTGAMPEHWQLYFFEFRAAYLICEITSASFHCSYSFAVETSSSSRGRSDL